MSDQAKPEFRLVQQMLSRLFTRQFAAMPLPGMAFHAALIRPANAQ